MDKNTEAIELIKKHGSVASASRATGIPKTTLKDRRDAAVKGAMDDVGTDIIPDSIWIKTKKHSVYLRPQQDENDFKDLVRDTIQETFKDITPIYPKNNPIDQDGLLVLDLADVHIGKLCVEDETGYSYDQSIAESRMVDGATKMVDAMLSMGAGQVLLIIGNDIAHIDTPKRTTTSGTPQDTDGTYHSIYRTAQRAYVHIVNMCLDRGLRVHLLYCPSNHDWTMGFTIAQALAIWFRDCDMVKATDYNLSESHRKYFRFGKNLMGFTHGDGAKERDLPHLMRAEAKSHISEVDHLYWYVHHYHHKIKRHEGVRPTERERDHIDLTTIKRGWGEQMGDNCKIEYVRSPSPPDGWHDRNGYVNKQAVECFLHHPDLGQTVRLTEWV